jgi:ribonuclease BN (tRNA processing enzyme)
MDITVLGAGAAFPRAGGACSGFLVRGGGATVWVDAGNGTFSRLQQVASWRDVDAMIVTHAHADHIADIVPLMYAIGFDDHPPDEPLPIYAPADVPARLSSLVGGETSKALFKKVFTFRPLVGDLEINGLSVRPFRTEHPIESFGLRLIADGKSVVYTSDTAFFPELVAHCRDADLLITEATYVGDVQADSGVHMWARESGKLAADAGVKSLVLTHVWATLDPAQAEAEAREAYAGPVEAAVEGKTYTI